MSADNKKQELRSMLEGKSTAELEELLALEATEFDAAGPNVDLITAALEVIAERENTKEHDAQLTEQAWKDFQEYVILKEQESSESDNTEEQPLEHRRIIKYGQRSPRFSRAVRIGLVAAVVAVLLCTSALGWNVFRAVAGWTEETFSFLTGQERQPHAELDVFRQQRLSVERRTNVPAMPNWVPDGTNAMGWPSENERTDRSVVQSLYTIGDREFTIRITIYNTPPEAYHMIYQKDATADEVYSVGDISHYIVGNNNTCSATWINGCVEGHIQGELTLAELRQMLDSIYKE